MSGVLENYDIYLYAKSPLTNRGRKKSNKVHPTAALYPINLTAFGISSLITNKHKSLYLVLGTSNRLS